MRLPLLYSLFVVVCTAALLPGIAWSQVQYGTVTYTASPTFRMTPSHDAVPQTDKVAKMLRDFSAGGGFDKQYTLTFTSGAYLFQEIAKPGQTLENGGMTVTILNDQTDPEAFYTDTQTDTYVNQEAIADRLFLHDGSVQAVNWIRLESTIPASDATLGFELKTATAITSRGDSLTAAYAPALPLPFGPRNYYGLPGAILQLDVCRNESCTRYRATKMSVLPVEPTLSPPTEGKHVSRERFNALRDKFRARKQPSTTQIVRQN
ncbi:GLPGLI family protein [Neolewinella xylanilytica]|uniref:GLPGLI family protein n=1 Tax=Neolewinella xylanilytica TaxID=1514080 RepID=A0A2S6I5A2_9BACT|nr:GLPGLI family protein [Neolewinella xylanilytica]PPK86325.1 GLPGLI family protein [Neolewinella xylanilytica]